VLRFFVICVFYFLVVLAQFLYKKVTYHFGSDPLDTFADLCQLSNISVFILDETLHGYYIHGRSVHPYTDVNMLKMQTNFREESDGKTPPRGLSAKTQEELAGYSNLVFEM
jgi:meckelin